MINLINENTCYIEKDEVIEILERVKNVYNLL